MVDPAAVVFQTKAQVVASLYPAQVRVRHVLIVPEDERIPRIRIPQIGKRIGHELERRNAPVGVIGSICTRNVQRVEPEIGVNVHVFSVKPQPRVTSVYVPQHVRRNLVTASQSHALNPAECIAVLPTAGGVASCGSQSGRIENERGRNTVPGEQHGLGARYVVDLCINSAQIVLWRSKWNELVRDIGGAVGIADNGRWNQGSHLHSRGIDPVRGNDVSRERGASSAVGISSIRVVNAPRGRCGIAIHKCDPCGICSRYRTGND